MQLHPPPCHLVPRWLIPNGGLRLASTDASSIFRKTTESLTVRIFSAQAAVVKNNFLISDIVAETEVPKPKTACSLSSGNSL
jgi:hypothetical protein